MVMEEAEKEEELFSEWPAEEGGQESTEEENEEEEKEMETERRSGLDIFRLSVSLASRRASLPCLAQLSAMHLTHLTHLTHLHKSTKAPSPVSTRHRLKDGEVRKAPHSEHEQNQEEKNKPECEKQPSGILKLPHVPENRAGFRSRNVLSLSDADSTCLICHDGLCRRGGGTIQELHCSHSFHSQCIEEWLWMKQTCPICHKHMAMPEPLYWTSAHLKVP